MGPVPQGRQEHRLGSPYAWRRRGEPVDGSSAPAPPASLKIHAFDGRRGRERGNRARAECAQSGCGPPPAAPPRRGHLALRLRRVVLPRLLRLRAVPARLHGVDVADRPQPAEPDDALRRARQLHRAPPRLLLLERGREHARDLGALHCPPAPARARARASDQHQAPRANLLPHERPAPAGDLARRRRPDLHAAVLTGLRAVQLPARRDRDQPGRLGGRPILVLGRALRDGHVALDGIQRAPLPRRHAGDPAKTSTSRPRSTARDAGGSSGTSPCR